MSPTILGEWTPETLNSGCTRYIAIINGHRVALYTGAHDYEYFLHATEDITSPILARRAFFAGRVANIGQPGYPTEAGARALVQRSAYRTAMSITH